MYKVHICPRRGGNIGLKLGQNGMHTLALKPGCFDNAHPDHTMLLTRPQIERLGQGFASGKSVVTLPFHEMQLFTNMKHGSGMFGNWLSKLWRGIKDGVGGIWKKHVKPSISDSIQKGQQAVIDKVGEHRDKLIGQGKDAIVDLIGGLVGKQPGKNLGEHLEDFRNGVGDAIADVKQTAKDQVAGGAKDLSDKVQAALGSGSGSGGETSGSGLSAGSVAEWDGSPSFGAGISMGRAGFGQMEPETYHRFMQNRVQPHPPVVMGGGLPSRHSLMMYRMMQHHGNRKYSHYGRGVHGEGIFGDIWDGIKSGASWVGKHVLKPVVAPVAGMIADRFIPGAGGS